MNTFTSLFAIIADTTLKATVLLALAWVAGRALKSRSSASRHMVRTFALCAALLLPLLTSLLPVWRVRGVPEFVPDIQPRMATQSIQPVVQSPNQATATAAAAVRGTTKPKLVREKGASAPAVASLQQPQSPQEPAETAIPASPRTLAVNWLQLLGVVWLLGAAVFTSRILISRWRLRRLVRYAIPLIEDGWSIESRAVARVLGIRRSVALLQSTDTEVPLTTGALRPKIILPADHDEWSTARRSAVLHHELAHIKRFDTITQAMSDFAVALYWFHPLVWITATAIRAERERACDDYVLAMGAKPSEYAHELLEIASSLRQPALGAALAMARRSQLEGRLMALLNPALRRGSVSRKVALAIAALTLCVVFPLAAIRAAQQSKPSPAMRDQVSTPRAEHRPATPESKPEASADDEDMVEPPEPPEPPEAPEAAEPPQSLVQELSELQARITALSVQSEALRNLAQSPEVRNKEEVLQSRMAELQARLAETEAQFASQQSLVVRAAPAMPGIQGGVVGGVPGGQTGGIVSGIRAVPSAPGVPGVPGVPAVPAVPAVPPAPASELNVCGTHVKLHNMSINSDNGHQHWTAYWSGDDCSVDLRADGKIEFNADATDIQSISSGGFFEVDQRQGNTWKQIRVTPSGNGLQYAYKVNGSDQAFDSQAKAWFSNFLLELERSTGFAAESRVRKLLEKGGPTAVLDEINNLRGDYVRGIYFRKLLDQPNLPSPVVVRIINQAGQQIGSDYEMARVLMEVARQYSLPDETSRTAFLNAAGKLKSDYEHSRVLIELLKRPNISSQDVSLALHSAAGIQSDYEKSRILLSLLDQKSFDQTYLDFYLKMVASIQSDYEKSRDLLAPMQKYPLDIKQINQIMEATATIGSDYEKSRLLTGLVAKGKFDEKQMGEYLKVVDSIGSDYERSRSLLALMEHNTLSKDAVGTVLDATGRMHSDYEKSRVLLTVAQKYPLEGALRDKYISIANSLGEYERNRALAGIVKRASI